MKIQHMVAAAFAAIPFLAACAVQTGPASDSESRGAALGAVCGGSAGTACGPGLGCEIAKENRADSEATGVCVAAAPGTAPLYSPCGTCCDGTGNPGFGFLSTCYR